jgi:predicted component of viral defense system (DUF524 family)
MKALPSIEINLDFVREGLKLWIGAQRPNSLFDEGTDAERYNEAQFQLVEGFSYDYQLTDPQFILGDVGYHIIQPHLRNPSLGTIAPSIYVGTLFIPILEKDTEAVCTKILLEVRSEKPDSREDYRDMLELITDRCTDLLLRANSPVSAPIGVDHIRDSQTLYQKFAFIKSVIGTDEFSEAIHRIVSAPVTRWTETNEERDIRNIRRLSGTNLREIVQGGKRTGLPEAHFMRSYGLVSIPTRIASVRKTDSVDTPENRFVKHALENFLKVCTDINNKARQFGHKNLESESGLIIHALEGQLHHSVFKDISRPTTLKLNSPVLQRKEGYREVLRVWLMFDLAAKLIWKGGDDIYSGGKKDVATLYEYWLFFKLLDLFQEIFDINPKDIDELIKETEDGLNLEIKQGVFTALTGVYASGSRKLQIQFNYNRSFFGRKSYPDSGSWTTTLRPDYTLSFWPYGISEPEAEKQELIVHVHFDAKYKIANLTEFLENKDKSEEELDNEKKEHRKGIYKNADLMKMHAYKDAIRRTGGAYVLYPGHEPREPRRGFHEIIPGLGAFPVRPSKKDSGIGELKAFILKIVEHFQNRASQREKFAYQTLDIHKNPPESENVVMEPLPETYNANRGLIPDDTNVLVGFYKSRDHHRWIQNNKLYNFRMGSGAGSLLLNKETVSAKYLLLHTFGDNESGDLWKIIDGPRAFSKEDLVRKGYPSPSQNNYLIFEIAAVTDREFENVRWNFKKLSNYSAGTASAFPFTSSLTELMRNTIK